MSKKPSHRKKASPAKWRRKTFTITVEAQPMIVKYEPDDLLPGYAHFEFRSPHKPARRIPVSETGYRSESVAMTHVKQARSPEKFARAYVLEALDRKRSTDPRQLALFR